MSESLPPGWVAVQLRDVVDVLDSRRVPINEAERTRRLAGSSVRFPYYGATGQVGEIDDFIFEGEAILLGEDGAPFLDAHRNKAYLVDGKYWVNNHAHILRAKNGFSNRFLCHQLNLIDYHPYVSGTTRLKLTKGAMSEIRLLVGPSQEQDRIASKIDQLFSRIDEGERALERVQKLMERYRQSVLKAAVTGELTREWREKNKDTLESGEALLDRILKARRDAWEKAELEKMKAKGITPANDRWKREYKAPMPPDTTGLPELPEGWVWVGLDALCDIDKNALKAGPFGSSLKKSDYSASGYKVYGQEQVIAGDCLIGDYYVAEPKFRQLESCKVVAGDVLISLVGTIGKVLVLPRGCEPGIINPRLIKVSLDQAVFLPEFFKIYFESAFLKALYKLDAHGATMDVLNLGIIRKLPFPLCSVAEQSEITRRAYDSLDRVARLNVECEAEQSRATGLRQSILEAAFAGALVPQDPSNEPAAKLLERIVTARSTTNYSRSLVEEQIAADE